MAERVRIFEVGPRDGLQNEPRVIPLAEKVQFIDLLSACGFDRIEVASFVAPSRVPQMADSADVLACIARKSGVRYAALTPNVQGYNRAYDAQADEIAIFASASEGFSCANLNCSIEESLTRFEVVATCAKADGVPMRGYVSCVTDCPYDGPTAPASVARVVEALFKLGCYEVSLGDTIGRGSPDSIAAMLDAVLTVAGPSTLAGHYHDTGGGALANIEVSLTKGLRVFDASAAGIGGCPFAPGATGNVATGAVFHRLNALGYETGIDPLKLAFAEGFAAQLTRIS